MGNTDFESLQAEFQKQVGAYLSLKLLMTAFRILILNNIN